jgi:putative FmdB family regulatory protein
MPTYEFRCRACGATFEEQRSMADSDLPARCPDGHQDTTRLLSVFASTGTASAALPSFGGSSGGGGGGCCGGACGCG